MPRPARTVEECQAFLDDVEWFRSYRTADTRIAAQLGMTVPTMLTLIRRCRARVDEARQEAAA